MDTTPRPVTLACLSTMLVALLAACAGPTAPGSPGATAGGAAPTSPTAGAATEAPGSVASLGQPCSLLTAADIERATGFKPMRQTPTTAPGELPVGCEWELDNPGETPWAIVLGVRSPGGAALYFPERGEPLEGIGDAALQSEAAVVEAVKGDTFISVTYMEFPERAEATAELARLILEKVQ